MAEDDAWFELRQESVEDWEGNWLHWSAIALAMVALDSPDDALHEGGSDGREGRSASTWGERTEDKYALIILGWTRPRGLQPRRGWLAEGQAGLSRQGCIDC